MLPSLLSALPYRPYFAVVDFEATCWADASRRGDSEIIQIGCVRMRRDDAVVSDEFEILVRPTRYPVLSELCKQITGLRQEAVDTAMTFPAAHARFTEWIGDPSTHSFCSWGAYDKFLLRAACAFHRLPFPFDDHYLNIKPLFSGQFTGREVSMERALDMVGAPMPVRRHHALDDARSAALLLREVLRS